MTIYNMATDKTFTGVYLKFKQNVDDVTKYDSYKKLEGKQKKIGINVSDLGDFHAFMLTLVPR